MAKMEEADRVIIREIARMFDEAADEALQTAYTPNAPIGGRERANLADDREAAALAYCGGFFRAVAILASTIAKKWTEEEEPLQPVD